VCTVHGRLAASFERGEYARTILGHASLPIAPAAMMCRVFVMAILPRVKRENTFAQGRSSASCQQIIGPNREMSDTFARSVMDRVGDRSDRAYAHDFTNTLRTKRIHSFVGLIDKRDIEIPDVRIHGHRVLCKVAVQKTAIARVYFTGFAQGRFDSPDDAAIRLAHRSAPADDPAAIDYANVAGDMGSGQAWVNSDLGEMRDV
jgi:hypothetical protein